MNFKEHYYINEMLVVGDMNKGSNVIAFDKWIWILNDEIEGQEKEVQDIIDKLGLDKKAQDFDDIHSFINDIQENKNDVLTGQIQNKNLYLYDYGSFKLDPKSSVLVKKVVNQLKLKSASYSEDMGSTETSIKKKKMTMQIPETAYHGTSTEYLNQIMRIGLRPGETNSNYEKQEIEHPELIFFTTRIGEAMHHAQHTASLKGGTAIILELKIPDKSLMIADYDVEKLTDKSTYYAGIGPAKNKFQGSAYKQDPDKLSKEFGVYGYKGNIKPTFIKSVYVANKSSDEIYNIKTDFTKMNPKKAIKLNDQGYFDL